MMDGEILLLLAIVFVLLSGSLLGWVNFFAVRRLRGQISALEAQLASSESAPAITTPSAPAQEPAAQPLATEAIQQDDLILDLDLPSDTADSSNTTSTPEPLVFAPPRAAQTLVWWTHLKDHWMVWLGAICVGLAGVFLAAYSIEQDYLGPQARLSLGLITGFLLHGAAEVLRRRARLRYESLAGLAAGASVILYATLLASVHLYELWPNTLVFVLLALVSLGTMALSLQHGPLLAIIGIVGAYAVPALLGDESGDVRILLGYCLIIAGSGFWLLSRVYRSWLFYIILGGALSWCWLLLDQPDVSAFLPIYLFGLGALLVTLPYGRWKQIPEYQDDPLCSSLLSFFQFSTPRQRDTALGLLALLFVTALIADIGQELYIIHWLFMLGVVCSSRHLDESLKLIPWAAVILLFLNVLGTHLYWGSLWPLTITTSTDSPTLFVMLALVSVLVLWFSMRTYRQNRYPALSLSLATLTPLMALATAWMLGDVSFDAWYWAAVCIGLGAFYADRARRRWQTVVDAQVVWWFIAAHAAYSLAAVMALSHASLTLALAVQVATIVWLMQRFELPILRWLLRAVMTLIIVRLTLNPWLPDYATSSRLAGDTWVFWTYGGTLALVALARWLATGLKDTQRWLEGAMLHLLVLFIAVCVRYALYEGEVFAWRYTFTEASLYTSVLAALGIVYAVRARRADTSAALLGLAATVLLSASVVQYLWLAVVQNPLWQRADVVGSTPIANLLLLSYGLPVLLFALATRWGVTELRRTLGFVAAGALWWFVTLEVRHLWHGQLWWGNRMSSGELYSYSLAWLVLAVLAMLLGSWRQKRDWYRGGMGLLLLVIAKIFIVDMSDLTGLWRVASFMGLGLTLLGLAYVHQVLGRRAVPIQVST
ncbi:DUF2339 domain-containing protein [Salinispirillum sp. LH 10-3-1]|uniref:DUF2339 domain-containing protein n=1 Tax=Salinispirillum sp. LH 10-3-1 TaxID=2952525 RepID=A0AB38YG43_9GAMM